MRQALAVALAVCALSGCGVEATPTTSSYEPAIEADETTRTQWGCCACTQHEGGTCAVGPSGVLRCESPNASYSSCGRKITSYKCGQRRDRLTACLGKQPGDQCYWWFCGSFDRTSYCSAHTCIKSKKSGGDE